ncbi:MAG: ABC transporter substrate-binding protein, partial [Fretibacterium sp.]
YGTSVPGDTSAGAITPDELEKHGVKCYNITESLIRVMKKPPVSLEDTYTDLRNLGVIFDVQDRAEQRIASMKERAAAVEAKLAGLDAAKPIGVFIYQTWNAPDQPPRTVGGQAMPSALMKMAKARNVFDDIDDSYVKVTWEDVVGRNPDVILLLECGNANGAERKKLLMEDPVLQGVKAIQDDRVIVMRVEETYPGPRAALGLEAIARALYPDRF